MKKKQEDEPIIEDKAKKVEEPKKEKKTSKSDTKKKKNDESKLPLYEKIAKYIEKNKDELNESVDLIFVEQEADKNTLYQTIEKVGEVKEFTLLKRLEQRKVKK